MKKVLAILFVFMMMIFQGCKVQSGEEVCNIKTSFDGRVLIVDSGKNYKCDFIHTPEGVNIIKVVEPESLAGLTFSWENDKYNVSWKDLSCEFNKQFLPDASFLSDIVSVMNSLHKEDGLKIIKNDDGERTFEGNSDIGNFRVVFDKDGELKQIDIDEKGICVQTEIKK